MAAQARLESSPLMPLDFETTIAGMTHSKILTLNPNKRRQWYQTLTPEEKAEAMRIVDIRKRAMCGAVNRGRILTEEQKTKHRAAMSRPETKAKISKSLTGRKHTEESKTKMRAAKSGMNHPLYGKPRSEEFKTKLRAALTGKTHSEATKAKMRAAQTGKNNPMYGRTGEKNSNWKNGVSFEPYCPAFNGRKREHIRNLCDRTCTICGDSILQYHKKHWKIKIYLHVDHLDENKMQGCSDWEWRLTALCPSCHGKMSNQERHLLLRLLLLKNKRHQTNFLMETL